MMPRKITIFLSAPPGDSLRASRDHFHEYVKPVLVAGALDWEVVEGRREGDVRAGLAAKIRNLRQRNGEQLQRELSEDERPVETKDDLFYEMRKTTGVREWNGVRGDLVLGRNTWKEYIRGIHEGWLGPLEPPKPQETIEIQPGSSAEVLTDPPSSITTSPETKDVSAFPTEPTDSAEPVATEPPAAEKTKQPKPSPTPPFITPSDYPSRVAPPFLVSSMQPALPVPLPHILGFLNTPTRMHRFLTRRRLADETGRSVAALVLASHFRPYYQSEDFASAIDPDEASPSSEIAADGAVTRTGQSWEQEAVLKEEEREWHKSAWKDDEKEPEKERIWREPMVVDGRIGPRMSQFELESGMDERAVQVAEERRRSEPSLFERVREWSGFEKKPRGGWDMGLEGNTD